MPNLLNRVCIVAGNWKMNLGPAEALDYFSKLQADLKSKPVAPNSRWVVFPPAYALGPEVQAAGKAAHVELGAQNAHWAPSGAFTGELSATALKSIGISWVLIGHSERRQYFGETDEAAAKRFAQAATSGLNIIYCVGERLDERESGQTEKVLTRQLSPFVDQLKRLIAEPGCPWPKHVVWSVAYEPVWAIGTGRTATVEQAQAAHQHIRNVISGQAGVETGQRIPLLYGGSVTPENAASLGAEPDVDGVLVGGASLKPESFARILASL